MRLGCDIDGCIADFNTAFMALIYKQTGIALPPVSLTYPDVWSYHRAGGVTKEQDHALWAEIKDSAFWATLPALAGAQATLALLQDMRYAGHHIYFITSRPGEYAKLLTEDWLVQHGFRNPTVLIANRKGPVALGLELDVFIDDKIENCIDVLEAGVDHVFLVNRPYNSTFSRSRIWRVPEALDAVYAVLKKESQSYVRQYAA